MLVEIAERLGGLATRMRLAAFRLAEAAFLGRLASLLRKQVQRALVSCSVSQRFHTGTSRHSAARRLAHVGVREDLRAAHALVRLPQRRVARRGAAEDAGRWTAQAEVDGAAVVLGVVLKCLAGNAGRAVHLGGHVSPSASLHARSNLVLPRRLPGLVRLFESFIASFSPRLIYSCQ